MVLQTVCFLVDSLVMYSMTVYIITFTMAPHLLAVIFTILEVTMLLTILRTLIKVGNIHNKYTFDLVEAE